MCGIAGFFDPVCSAPRAHEVLGAMASVLRHRGPDGEGLWFDETLRIGLAHRRLAIVDLSAAGAQPMASASGRYVIAFNGEIYNHAQVRRELLARDPSLEFRGHSDTEVFLAACEVWGADEALARANGMFAIALVDRLLRQLHLLRDRIGEKPLYFGRLGRAVVFASELKALHAHPAWQGRIDPAALSEYFRCGHVPAPRSIYAGIAKVQPGEWVTIDVAASEPVVRQRRYWTAADAIRAGRTNPLDIGPEEARERLEALLDDAVALRMEADVPLGAFLSGGIDSSLVVALMQRRSPDRVRTFSIGFREARFDEAPAARAVARHLGTDHTELYVSPHDSLEVIPRLAGMYDEPFADASSIPTHLVARLARQHVTVSLSGDGGDELFCGYGRYQQAMDLWKTIDAVPAWARHALSGAIRSVPVTTLNALGNLLPRRLTAGRAGDRAHRAANRLSARNFDEIYRGLLSSWQDPARAVHREIRRELPVERPPGPGTATYEHMMAADLTAYLPNDVLVKVDRATMAVSLEGRMPLLDHRVVELAWRLPLSLKRRDGTGKWLLRELLYRHVPRSLVDRPKRGFGVPVGEWLQQELQPWATDLLGGEAMRDGLLNARRISRMLHEHVSGQRSWTSQLWTALMFQAWRHEVAAAGSERRAPVLSEESFPGRAPGAREEAGGLRAGVGSGRYG